MEVGGEGGRHDAFIHEIARDPELHAGERGVGTALLREGMTAARGEQGRKVGVVQLLVDIGNTDAIAWYRARGFKVVTAYTEEDGTMRGSEVPGAQAMYLPEWQLGRRRGMPRRPKQLCMQADGATLIQGLQASRGAKQASCTRVHEQGSASELRGGAAWATVTALVDSAHEAARGAAHGGSGRRAEDLLPSGEEESRTIYVLAYARAGPHGPSDGPDPSPGTTPRPDPAPDPGTCESHGPGTGTYHGHGTGPRPGPSPTPRRAGGGTGAAGREADTAHPAEASAPCMEGWQEELDLERELEMEREMAAEAEAAAADGPDGPQPWPEDCTAQEPGCEAELEAAMRAAEGRPWPGSPCDSSPASTPPPSTPTTREPSRATSPAAPRPASPSATRWEELVQADCTEGDEDETVERMAARLLEAHKEDEAHRERRHALQARANLNARKGFTHWLPVGDIDGMAQGTAHERRCASEGGRIGRARASEEGVGPRPRPLGLSGRCPGCGKEGECTPKQVILGECRCIHIDWGAYGALLAEALRAVEKSVPAMAVDEGTPMAAWCECRRVVRAARLKRRSGAQRGRRWMRRAGGP